MTAMGDSHPQHREQALRMLQFYLFMAAIVQWQNAGLWHRMSWVRPPLAAPKERQRITILTQIVFFPAAAVSL